MDGRLTRWGVVGLAVAVLSSVAWAQSPDFTPATEQAIKSYAIDAAKAGVLIDALTKNPAIGPVLKARGLSPQQYSHGVLALRAASLAHSGQTDGLARLASPGNIAMLKANPDISKRFAQAESGK